MNRPPKSLKTDRAAPPAASIISRLAPWLGMDVEPAGLRRWGQPLLSAGAWAMGRVHPITERRYAWQELEAALGVLRHFKQTHQGGLDSAEDSLWANEGQGFALANRGAVDESLRWESLTEAAADLPPPRRATLQAGFLMGACIRLLRTGISEASLLDFLDHVDRLRPSIDPTLACEILGLVSRLQFEAALPAAQELLQRIDPTRLAPFWHGVGRGLYFSFPRAFDRADTWRTLQLVHLEAPDAASTSNALSGLAWPLLFLHLKKPVRLATLLHRHEAQIAHPEALSAGLGCAALIHQVWAGDDGAALSAFLRHRPPAPLDATWERRVAAPCRRALDENSGLIAQCERFAPLFRYHPLTELPNRLRECLPTQEGHRIGELSASGPRPTRAVTTPRPGTPEAAEGRESHV